MIADVAHNPAGVAALLAAVRRFMVGTCLMVFGVMKDKDYASMLDLIGGTPRVTIAVKPGIDRALASSTISDWLQRRRHAAIDGGAVGSGLRIAASEARPGETILVTGSHYVVGEAIEHAASTRVRSPRAR